ncbi:MAG: site-specific DNA-methyltransferase [Acidimicrobiia bacterium]|nr:site-specific DNA-methyltransferase [Acidimicrobiia bacterium]
MVDFVLGSQVGGLADYVPSELWEVVKKHGHQKALPRIARTPALSSIAEDAARRVPSQHRILLGDSRTWDDLPDESVHLVITSPPYWNLKPYESGAGQLGLIEDFDDFLDELDRVWTHCLRALTPGGRLIIITGDVLVPRRKYGRHVVFPLHAAIQERTRRLGFDNLAPIIWYKIGNSALEVENGGRFLGKPYEPNGIIKNDIEFILFQRKPGGYRSPSLSARLLSVIPSTSHSKWFRQVWNMGGASTSAHPAPYPERLIVRLIRMFSFVGDTVLDPFLGSGTTAVGAGNWGRNSIGGELEDTYFNYACDRITSELGQLQLMAG